MFFALLKTHVIGAFLPPPFRRGVQKGGPKPKNGVSGTTFRGRYHSHFWGSFYAHSRPMRVKNRGVRKWSNSVFGTSVQKGHSAILGFSCDRLFGHSHPGHFYFYYPFSSFGPFGKHLASTRGYLEAQLDHYRGLFQGAHSGAY